MTVETSNNGLHRSQDPTALTNAAVSAAKIEIEKLFDEKLDGHMALIVEKFRGVGTEFTMRDIALTAALKAAQEQGKQQNDSNTLANDKMEKSFGDQIKNLDTKITDLKDIVAQLAGKNWQVVGAYIIGALGVVGLIIAALEYRH